MRVLYRLYTTPQPLPLPVMSTGQILIHRQRVGCLVLRKSCVGRQVIFMQFADMRPSPGQNRSGEEIVAQLRLHSEGKSLIQGAHGTLQRGLICILDEVDIRSILMPESKSATGYVEFGGLTWLFPCANMSELGWESSMCVLLFLKYVPQRILKPLLVDRWDRQFSWAGVCLQYNFGACGMIMATGPNSWIVTWIS